MDLVFGGEFDYDRLGLVLISLGMGLYLAAATLNQALLARGRARAGVRRVGGGRGRLRRVPAVPWTSTTRCWASRSATWARRCVLCGLLYGQYRRG